MATLDAIYDRKAAVFLKFYALLMTFLLKKHLSTGDSIRHFSLLALSLIALTRHSKKRTINIHIGFFKHPKDAQIQIKTHNLNPQTLNSCSFSHYFWVGTLVAKELLTRSDKMPRTKMEIAAQNPPCS